MSKQPVKFRCPYCRVEQYQMIDTVTTRHVLLCDIENVPGYDAGCDKWFVGLIELKIKTATFRLLNPDMQEGQATSCPTKKGWT